MKTQLKNNLSKKIEGLPTFNIVVSDGRREGVLFANGNMQLGIVINIQATTDNYDEEVKLSDEQLNSIELVNKITDEKLSSEWSYSSEENDYLHQFPQQGLTENTNLSPDEIDSFNNKPEAQKKIYWLKTTAIETIEIIARVTLDGKTFLSDDEHGKGSHISVTGRKEIIYHANGLVRQTEKNVANGTYKCKVTTVEPGGPFVSPRTVIEFEDLEWIQDNHYIYINDSYNFSVHDVDIKNTINDNDISRYDYRRFTHHTKDDQLYLWFLWGKYKAKRTAGADYQSKKDYFSDSGISITREATPQVEIDTTPRTDVVSLSRLYFKKPINNFWVDEANQVPQFKFRDIYGNESVWLKIIMDVSDSENEFHLQEG
ncbi:hypothetical protein PXH59_11910 [Xenorhabdus sp. SF857]|uniref:hypothetical protein n=1 Tax=Xenorhabdus bakwenae TaxID=3026967 RepID=UPI0025581A96|nr:hypothetical protein [Xenorhabdus sp. SF857]WFQ78443.1 hypothetical protein PXH59_11910 [Xenorhabdus sp. SF857]